MKKTSRVFLYFSCWIFIALICIVLNIINIDWTLTDTINGIFIVVVLGVLQGSVLEFPVQTIATLIIGGERRENKRALCDRLTVILNYNLLATSKDDILECIETMYMAYVGNLSPNVSAVLVSATTDDELREYELQIRDTYRAILYDDLYREGLAFAKGEYDLVDPIHLHNVWAMYVDIEKDIFITEYLEDICDRYAREFMVVHRVSRVLRKCGQYQDLMLLSEGEFEAFSYCDCNCYGKCAREVGEPLFHSSEDVSNILERKFDYTLVLDADTGVPRGGVFDLLQIAAAHPERGIIQPSIKLHCSKDDTMFMHLESMRQAIYEPMTNAITALFNQSSYFGKALIKNKLYIDYVIGSKDDLIERVPVDVLSHDTFEAALLKPLYAGSTYLLEAPSHNYVTWNIRERRWNRGEILLAMYFWKNGFGKPMRWIQKRLQRSKFNKTKVKTESKLDFITSYIAHSALRQMLMKPALLLYICLHISVHLRYRYASIIIVMFSVLVFPKFATCNRENYKYVILETVASILQFTPEALVGCVRIWRALYANISLNAKWIPQRAVEEEFKISNPFVSSFKHLWGYSLFALVSGILVVLFLERAMLVLVMLITLLLLPLYTGFTSLTPGFKCCKPKQSKLSKLYGEKIARNSWETDDNGLATISSGDTYRSLGKLDEGFKFDNGCKESILSTSAGSTSTSFEDTNIFGRKKVLTGTTKSWSAEVERLIEGEGNGYIWPRKSRSKQNRRLSSRTYTTYDYSDLREDKYVTIINVTSPDPSNRKESIRESQTPTNYSSSSSSDNNPNVSSGKNVHDKSDYEKLEAGKSKDYETLRNLDENKLDHIWYKNNITYVAVGDFDFRKARKNDTDNEVKIRRTLNGKTYSCDDETESESSGSSVEKLYQNIGLLKQFTSNK
ncbi:uncharacterized protein LOC123547353 [Mercenaria mercenaria]|uniref:uncharacterized protein LOC123547353 n=1 Tax=Mercenaria mercenaria TaxID=6596 RepID=UPI00234F183A|nr:uncharacterized protein LOC123547353 [Mercenaria mercenaria]